MSDDSKITRVEVIDEQGRSYVRWNCAVQLARQDGGRTLKLFVGQRPGSEEIRYAPGTSTKTDGDENEP